MYKWGVLKDQIKKAKRISDDRDTAWLKSRVNDIIEHDDTSKRFLSHWADVHDFIVTTFPDVDVSNVPIYETSPAAMKKVGFAFAAGCFIDRLNLILVKNNIDTRCNTTGKFARLMDELAGAEIQVEDVVVHEILHVVSQKVRGSASAKFDWKEWAHGYRGVKFRNVEEQFVYTNCLPYYRGKGMTNREVIDVIYLPFCISDVFSDDKFMKSFWDSVGVSCPNPKQYSEKKYGQLLRIMMDEHAESLAPRIVEEARQRAQKMIDLYDKYGCKMSHGNANPVDRPHSHVSTIDFDCDF